MITLKTVAETEKVKEFYLKKSLSYNGNSMCMTAEDRDELLGFCLFDLDDKGIDIRYLEPADDIGLADGILRSTLHVAAQRSIMDARYTDTAPGQLFKALGFVIDENRKTLDMDKLFSSCKNH